MKVPGAAINAAIRTSSTYPSRSSGGRASYRERVETILDAALPELEAAFKVELVSPRALEAAEEVFRPMILRGGREPAEILKATLTAAAKEALQ